MFKLEFLGLKTNTDEALLALRKAFIDELGFSADEALEFFTHAPCVIKESEDKAEIDKAYQIMQNAEAEVNIIEPEGYVPESNNIEQEESKIEESKSNEATDSNEIDFSFDTDEASETKAEEVPAEEIEKETSTKEEVTTESSTESEISFEENSLSFEQDDSEETTEETAPDKGDSEDKAEDTKAEDTAAEFSGELSFSDDDTVDTEETKTSETELKTDSQTEEAEPPSKDSGLSFTDDSTNTTQEEATTGLSFSEDLVDTSDKTEEKPQTEASGSDELSFTEEESPATDNKTTEDSPEVESKDPAGLSLSEDSKPTAKPTQNSEPQEEAPPRYDNQAKEVSSMAEEIEPMHVDFKISDKEEVSKYKFIRFIDNITGKLFGSDYIVPIILGCLLTAFISIEIFDVKFFVDVNDIEFDPQYSANRHARQTGDPAVAEAAVEHLKFQGESSTLKLETTAKFTVEGSKIKTAIFDVTPPPPPELTPEEIILNKNSRPWVEKISIERLHFSSSPDSDSFIASGRAKVFVIHGEDKHRIVTPVAVRAIYDMKKEIIKAAIILKNGITEIPDSENFILQTNSSETYDFYIKAYVEAEQVAEEEALSEEELSEEDLTKEDLIEDT